jgi:hypothetical protein
VAPEIPPQPFNTLNYLLMTTLTFSPPKASPWMLLISPG